MKTIKINEDENAEIRSLLLEAELDFEEHASFGETIAESDKWRDLAARCNRQRLALAHAQARA